MEPENEPEILNVRLPKDLVDWVDSLVEKGIYYSRSEMIRDTLREFVNSERPKNP